MHLSNRYLFVELVLLKNSDFRPFSGTFSILHVLCTEHIWSNQTRVAQCAISWLQTITSTFDQMRSVRSTGRIEKVPENG